MSNWKPEEQVKRQLPEAMRPYMWKKGQSGNPGGRPKGPSMRVWVQNMLAEMGEEERQEFLHGLPKDIIWKMAEGNPKNDVEIVGKVTLSHVLDEIEHGNTDSKGQGEVGEQTVENGKSLQDQGQAPKPDNVQKEHSPTTLRPTPVVEK